MGNYGFEKMHFSKRKLIIVLAAAIAIISLACFFIGPLYGVLSGGGEKAEARQLLHELNGIKLNDESSFGTVVKLALLKKQASEELGEEFKLTREETNRIEASFEESCNPSEPNPETGCPANLVLLPYYLYLTELKPGEEAFSERDALDHNKFRQAILSIKSYYLNSKNKLGQNAIQAMQVYKFSVVVGLLEKTGLLEENERSQFLLALKNTKVPRSIGSRELVRFSVGKINASKALSVSFKPEPGRGDYIKDSNLLNEICPLLPASKEIIELNDPCLAADYVHCLHFCNLPGAFDAWTHIMDFVVAQKYTSVEGINCQSFFSLGVTPLFSDRSFKNYVEEYSAIYGESQEPLNAFNVIAVIETEPGEISRVLKAEKAITEKNCASWSECQPAWINNHITVAKWRDPGFDVSADSALQERIAELYKEFKEYAKAEDTNFLYEHNRYLLLASQAGLLNAQEENFWVRELTGKIFESKKQPLGPAPFIQAFRFYLGVHSIGAFKEKARGIGVSEEKLRKAEEFLCTPQSVSIEPLTDEQRLNQVWADTLTKGFCGIPLTESDKETVSDAVHRNYLRTIYIGGVEDTAYGYEVIKYYLVNHDKIFSS